MKINWNNVVDTMFQKQTMHLYHKQQVHLDKDIALVVREYFQTEDRLVDHWDIVNKHQTHLVLELDLSTVTNFDDYFNKARKALKILRNDNQIHEVFMTMEAENKQMKGFGTTGLTHLQCIYRVKLR